MFAPSVCERPYVNGPGRPSESAFTTNPPKSGITAYTSRAARPHQPRTASSSGSAVDSPPSTTGAAKVTDRCVRIPYGRNVRAMSATSPIRSVRRCASVSCTLTLLTETALIPQAARSLA